MAEIRIAYGAATPITVDAFTSLANNASALAAVVDNTAGLFVDDLVEVVFTTASGAAATGSVELWAKGSIDNVDFDDDANDRLVAVCALGASGAQTRKRVASLAAAFGGTLPPYWQVRVRNATGATLASGTLAYRGVFMTSL